MVKSGFDGCLTDRNRARGRLATLAGCGVLAVSILALAPSFASAAIRHTSPTGSGTACSQASPCSFEQGVTSASDDDTVQLQPDEYDLTGLQVDVTANNLTIQGPGPVGDPLTFIPYLMFGGDSIGAAFPRLIFYGSSPKLKNLAVTGQGINALVSASSGSHLTLDRVIINYLDADPLSPTGGIAISGDSVTITNSVIRNEAGLSTSRALEASGTITGSLVYASNGTAISLDGQFHDAGRCTLTARNTVAWGGSNNLALSGGPGVPSCTSVTFDYDYSWIPLSSGAQTGGGYSPGAGTVELQQGTNNLPDTPAAVDPTNPGATIVPANSPAINAGCTIGCGTYDYYGRPRPIGAANDIGPYEATLPPTISNVTVDSKTSNEAEVSATVNPNGGGTTWNFQIRKVGASEWESFDGGRTGEGATPTTVRGTAQPLDPRTSYQLRLTGINSTGVDEFSPEITTFTTDRSPPVTSIRVRSAKPKVTRKGVSIRSRVRTSTPGRVNLRAFARTGAAKTWCRVRKRVGTAGDHTLTCQLGRKGRAKLRKAPLKLTLEAVLTADSGLTSAAFRNLTIRRKR